VWPIGLRSADPAALSAAGSARVGFQTMGRAVVATAIALALAAGTSASTGRNSGTIVPGESIGPVKLGMSLRQVQRLLGKPTLVNVREARGFGMTYLELDWHYARWTVGFLGKPGEQRAVKVATMLRSHRTREGLGVGSTFREVARKLPGVRCARRKPGNILTVRSGSGVRTIFLLAGDVLTVIEVIIERGTSSAAPREVPCLPGWRTRENP